MKPYAVQLLVLGCATFQCTKPTEQQTEGSDSSKVAMLASDSSRADATSDSAYVGGEFSYRSFNL